MVETKLFSTRYLYIEDGVKANEIGNKQFWLSRNYLKVRFNPTGPSSALEMSIGRENYMLIFSFLEMVYFQNVGMVEPGCKFFAHH
jgi:hypothetical protein